MAVIDNYKDKIGKDKSNQLLAYYFLFFEDGQRIGGENVSSNSLTFHL
jgi:hypothetical protein